VWSMHHAANRDQHPEDRSYAFRWLAQLAKCRTVRSEVDRTGAWSSPMGNGRALRDGSCFAQDHIPTQRRNASGNGERQVGQQWLIHLRPVLHSGGPEQQGACEKRRMVRTSDLASERRS
jgi:hypothetical protein